MTGPTGASPSLRHAELLASAYQYALEHGIAGLSLRPLATSIGSSPRVLLYLFGSKDGLIEALLARARDDELGFLGRLQYDHATGLADVTAQTWAWLAAPEHRNLLVLWVEAYGRSLVDPDGPWSSFARSTVEDWLGLLAQGQLSSGRTTLAGVAQRTLALAILRGCMLDLLATGDVARTAAALQQGLTCLQPAPRLP